ncbi:MAG: PatB family C-S lyase [Prolixibacteraceae bacterium]|jgi:cystathionine beta-lyase|nr:PatB family C-S lyase [Prolixibacteraceae bacterium]
MKRYNFDEIIPRKGTDCEKYDHLQSHFGNGNAIPLWVADGDFRVPDFITAAIRYRADHEIYAYSFRSDGFFNSIINWQQNRHGWTIEREMILPTQGVVSTLASIIMAFTEAGEKVIIQPPVYTPFFTCVKDCGRTVVENPLKQVNGSYTFDFEGLLGKIDKQTRLLILCNPHNPVGRVWSEEELLILGDICLENNILIISDEIHSDLVFSGFKHVPLPKISDRLGANCIVCMAPSKTFNIAGLATSFVIIPDKKIRQKFDHFLHALHLSNGNLFGTVALQAAYQSGMDWVNQQNAYLEANRDFMLAFFRNKMPRIQMTNTEATYLAWIDVREYGMLEPEMNRMLIDKAGIVLNKGSIYGKEGIGYFRLNFACPRQVLEEALTRMENTLGGG